MAAQQGASLMSTPDKLIGREKEITTLSRLFKSTRPEFLAIYGRRRVGKTFLVRKHFENKTGYFHYVTGVHNEPISLQIREFTKEVSRTFLNGLDLKVYDNWFDTFRQLTDIINKQIERNQKIVLFFDEFPWMVTHRSKLLQALDYYWNRHWSQDERIKLIICGSSASWIIRNIINNKGGLHNRLTHIILLEPLTLNETKRFLRNRGIKLNNHHVTQIYMVTGGIPYYLSHITSNHTATQIIEQLAFQKNSFLLSEFNKLYHSLFKDGELYIKLTQIIAEKRYGISQEELFRKSPLLSKGGTIVKKLRELEDTGFIISFKPYKNKRKGIYYKVIDEYTLFYFKWLEPIKETLIKQSLRKGYWEKIHSTPAWHNWAGYAFEAICYKHIPHISKALQLSPTALPHTWRHTPTKSSDTQGAQVDLLFDHDDHAITICEIKYTQKPFIIDKSYAKQLQNKMDTFKKITKTKEQLFLSIISATGIKETMYSEEMINTVVTLDDLFSTL